MQPAYHVVDDESSAMVLDQCESQIKEAAADDSCSSCIRSFQFLVRTQPEPQRDALGVQCFYEEEDDGEQSPPVKRKAQEMYEEVDPRVTVSQLEAKVGKYQQPQGPK